MTNYGTEVEIAYPTIGTKEETIRSIKGGEVKAIFKRISTRSKVTNKEQECTAFLNFTALITNKKNAETLLYKHTDPNLLPTLVIEYPKRDEDYWFVITSYTEVLR